MLTSDLHSLNSLAVLQLFELWSGFKKPTCTPGLFSWLKKHSVAREQFDVWTGRIKLATQLSPKKAIPIQWLVPYQIQAAVNNYFNYWMNCLVDQFIFLFKKCQKMKKKVKVRGDVSSSKTKKYSIYNDIKQEKAGTRQNYLPIKLLIDYQNCGWFIFCQTTNQIFHCFSSISDHSAF